MPRRFAHSTHSRVPASFLPDPREVAFDDPSLRKDDEAKPVIMLDVYVVE